MAESSNPTQIPSSPNVTPKEEPITLHRPESPNPFLPVDQVEFNFDEMIFTANNEMARDWVSTPTGGVRGKLGVTTFRNYIRAHYSDKYVDSPSLAIVKPLFAEIGYSGEIKVKGTLKKCCLPPSSETTKGGSSKRPTGSKTGHLKRKKESTSAMDSNPSQTSASTPVVAEMRKEDQQAAGDLTSLGVTSEEGTHP
nr:hypothetical protein [Tanacetum cinerariifolium]